MTDVLFIVSHACKFQSRCKLPGKTLMAKLLFSSNLLQIDFAKKRFFEQIFSNYPSKPRPIFLRNSSGPEFDLLLEPGVNVDSGSRFRNRKCFGLDERSFKLDAWVWTVVIPNSYQVQHQLYRLRIS